MIETMLAALVLSAQTPPSASPPNRGPDDWCRGIHMPNGGEGVNLLWTTFRGPIADLDVVRQSFEPLGVSFSDPVGEPGASEIRGAYRDDLDVRTISYLLAAVDRGELGQVTTQDYAMPLSTLPADTCIRFSPD